MVAYGEHLRALIRGEEGLEAEAASIEIACLLDMWRQRLEKGI